MKTISRTARGAACISASHVDSAVDTKETAALALLGMYLEVERREEKLASLMPDR
jgi:hypothetical protein